MTHTVWKRYGEVHPLLWAHVWVHRKGWDEPIWAFLEPGANELFWIVADSVPPRCFKAMPDDVWMLIEKPKPPSGEVQNVSES